MIIIIDKHHIFQMRPFDLMINHFEVSQKQNNVQNREKLRWKFAKKNNFKASRGFVYLFKIINLKERY